MKLLILQIYICLAIILVFFSACEKNDSRNNGKEGKAQIVLRFAGIDSEIIDIRAGNSVSRFPEVQTFETVDANGIKVTATLTESKDENNSKLNNSKRNKIAANPDTVRNPISDNLNINFFIYDVGNGNLLHFLNFKKNDIATVKLTPFELDGDKEYYFVAYADYWTDFEPYPPSNHDNYNTLAINEIGVDFLLFKKKIKINSNSVNTISMVFRHVFSEITTAIELDDPTNQYDIRAVSLIGKFYGAYSTADYLVHNDFVSYFDLITDGVLSSFSTNPIIVGKRSYGNPIFIISPETNTMQFQYLELAINPFVKTNIPPINDISVRPGVKYNLVFKVSNLPSIRYVDLDYHLEANQPSGTPEPSTTVTWNDTGNGAVLDIYHLDNSIKVDINGIQLFNPNVLNLEEEMGDVHIRFPDNTYYGNSGVSEIYWINEDKHEIPILRIIINPNGTVELFGRKNIDHLLEPLTLHASSLNTITWNSSGAVNNIITLSSPIVGRTVLRGRIYGLRI